MAETMMALFRNETDYFSFFANEAKDIVALIESYSSSDSELYETGKERLSTFLPEVVQLLSPEVEEMFYPVVNMRRLREALQKKDSSSNSYGNFDGKNRESMKKHCGYCSISEFGSDPDLLCATCLSAAKNTSDLALASLSMNEINEENEDVRFLRNIDASTIEETLEKYTNIHLKTLNHMEANIQNILDVMISSRKYYRKLCDEEKKQMEDFIQNLPVNLIDFICQILNKGVKVSSKLDLLEQLKKEDIPTLCCVYHYFCAFKRSQTRKR